MDITNKTYESLLTDISSLIESKGLRDDITDCILAYMRSSSIVDNEELWDRVYQSMVNTIIEYHDEVV